MSFFKPDICAFALAVALGCNAFTGHCAPRPSVTAAIDSSQITMGYRTAIKVDVVDSAGSPSQLVVDKAVFPQEVEIVDWVYGDTTDLGNGMVEMKRALVVQPFDSGVYTIPPFLLVNGPDTVRSTPWLPLPVSIANGMTGCLTGSRNIGYGTLSAC